MAWTVDRVAALFPQKAAIPAQHQLPQHYEQREYLIDGRLYAWDGPLQEVLSPVCSAEGLQQEVIGHYPLLTRREAAQALQAAARAYDKGRGAWPTMSVEERIQHVEQFAFRMTEKRDEVVRLLMWEIGKSFKDSQKEFDRTVDYIRDTIDALKELDRSASRFVVEQGVVGQIRRAPLGVVLCMGPFNYPLNETFTTLIPALIMGNTVIFKAPKYGVLLHRPLLEAFRDSFPPGVVNTVYGEGQEVIPPILESGEVAALAFIGSAKVSNILRRQHPKPNRMRCVLGLEAKNAGIVLADADIDLAVHECALGTLSFNGQRCTALKTLWVHHSIADVFLEKLSAAIQERSLGMPWDDGVAITPLPEGGKTQYLSELVEDAVAHGAKIINPGGGVFAGTLFVPALISPVNQKMRIWREEQFGPVVPVAVFDDIDEPVNYVVNSDYGQQVSIFGNDPDTIAHLIDPLVNQVCRVNLNSQCQRGPDTFPFTGRKDSAEGTLSVSDALRVFAIRTLVAAKVNPVNKTLITEIVRERKSKFLSTDFVL